MEQFAKELVKLRGENSKTYDLGGRKRRLITGGSIQHWKEDYSSKSEEWKECDLRWDGNRIDKAPYILVRDGSKVTFTDRKTSERSIIELLSSTCKDAKSISKVAPDYRIVPFINGVHFQRYITADTLPFEAQFKVEGKVPVSRAYDDEGELELEVTYDEKTGILTERLTEVRDKGTKELRQASGEIRIDPTLTVQPSSKDNSLRDTRPTTNYGTSTLNIIGYIYFLGSGSIYRSLVEFDIGDMPADVTIDSGKLQLCMANASDSDTYTASRLLRLDWHETQSTWNIYKTGSNWGTAGCANTSTDYTTTDAVGITIDSAGWEEWTITKQVEWAYTNNKAVAVRLAGATTSGTTSKQTRFYTKESSTDKPKLVIEYTEATTDNHKRSAFFPFM